MISLECLNFIAELILTLSIGVIAYKTFTLEKTKDKKERKKSALIVLDEIERMGMEIKRYYNKEKGNKDVFDFHLDSEWRNRISSLFDILNHEDLNELFELYSAVENQMKKDKKKFKTLDSYVEWYNFDFFYSRKEIIHIFKLQILLIHNKLSIEIGRTKEIIKESISIRSENNYQIENKYLNKKLVKQKIIGPKGDSFADIEINSENKFSGFYTMVIDEKKFSSRYLKHDIQMRSMDFSNTFLVTDVIEKKVGYFKDSKLEGEAETYLNNKKTSKGSFSKGIIKYGKEFNVVISTKYLDPDKQREYEDEAKINRVNQQINDSMIEQSIEFSRYMNKMIKTTVDYEISDGKRIEIIGSRKEIEE